jgi:hypothetical protein
MSQVLKTYLQTLLYLQGVKDEKTLNKQKNGKADYRQTLKYFPDPKHNGKDIKCVVDHMAYTEANIATGLNEISKRLELTCKKLNFMTIYILLMVRFLDFSQASAQAEGADFLRSEGGRD